MLEAINIYIVSKEERLRNRYGESIAYSCKQIPYNLSDDEVNAASATTSGRGRTISYAEARSLSCRAFNKRPPLVSGQWRSTVDPKIARQLATLLARLRGPHRSFIVRSSILSDRGLATD